MVVAVIPARYAASRLPGKPLADIGGKPMVVRVWERVSAARGIDRVVVATDDHRIAAAVEKAGGEVQVTPECVSGTDRVAYVARALGAQVVVNVQGDEPFIEPEVVERVASGVGAIQTAMVPLIGDPADPARVKVVHDVTGRALYFSRLAVPRGGPWMLHLGVYAFTAEVLDAIARLAPSDLERSEGLEQLRWMEAGFPVQMVRVDSGSLSVDTPDDLRRAQERWARENARG